MAENAWTQAEEAKLIDDFHAGVGLDDIAAALRKTPGSVRWKLTQLGLDTLPCAPPGTPKPQIRRAASRASARRPRVQAGDAWRDPRRR